VAYFLGPSCIGLPVNRYFTIRHCWSHCHKRLHASGLANISKFSCCQHWAKLLPMWNRNTLYV